MLAATSSSSFGGGGGTGGGAATDDDLATCVSRFSAVSVEDANQMQQLLLYLLNCAQMRGYRRCDGCCYRRVYTPEGHDTHAWELACTMQEFVYEVTRKELNYDMWRNLTSSRINVVGAVEHLKVCRDVQLADLRKDRHVFAFRNGIYMASEDRFAPYEGAGAAALPDSVVAAKYFDLPFAYQEGEADDWYSAIPTPHLQSILDCQDMDEQVARWMYVLIGRLMYDVNERDRWQVIPYLKGAASSGKSTILVRVCRGLYEPSDVGVISNNIERKFGLSALHDKLLFIGPEIKSDVSLEQAEFQSIISGETVQVAVKFQTARTVEWRVPGIMAGNEVPGWVDNSGSVNRRIVLFEFARRIENGDMELGKKLDGEMAAIVLKANRAYLQAVRLHARDNIWNHLPPEFHRSRDEFTESVNSLVHFLRSGVLRFDKAAYMPLGVLTERYQSYVKQMGLERLKSLTADTLRQPLMGVGCYVTKRGGAARRYPRHDRAGMVTMVSGAFVVGADLAESFAVHEQEGPPLTGTGTTAGGEEDDDPLGD